MSFILVPSEGEDLQVNAWNWRPTLELLHGAHVISDEDYDLMGANGCGGRVDAELASRIATVIAKKILEMNPEERMLADLSVSAEPKKEVEFGANMNVNDIDAVDLYSAKYEWLKTFAEFCRNSGGFMVV